MAASETIRLYGFCGADPWSREEAKLADRLLACLQARAAQQRGRLGREGLPCDRDAYLWAGAEPHLGEELERAVGQVSEGQGPEQVAAVRDVATRLLGQDHAPAVRDALGCLIPAELHPELDARQRRGKLVRNTVPGGVKMAAGRWQVSVFEEQVFAQCLPLPKDLLEL